MAADQGGALGVAQGKRPVHRPDRIMVVPDPSRDGIDAVTDGDVDRLAAHVFHN